MIISFFKSRNSCKHRKVTPFSAGSFCPDCGKEIRISWVILRCACCNSKREANVVFNSLSPKSKFCIKCGTSEYIIQKKEHIEFFDLCYAVISKIETNNTSDIKEILQVWVDNERKSSDGEKNLLFIPLLAK